MTRINCVPVETLTNKHLLAEYKEITRPFNKVIARIEKNTYDDAVIPAHYCLGKGHETFFFDKLGWLHDRYDGLCKELINRDFDINVEQFGEISSKFINQLVNHDCFGSWTPTPEDMYLNMARLAKRSNLDVVLNELEDK